MTQPFDVIVVGGGPVGAACARELAASGRRILLLDRGERGGEAWRASAGMLAAQVTSSDEDPLFELGLAGREYYADLAPQLRDSTGIDVGFWQEGIARLAADESDAAALRSMVARQRQQGHVCDWFDAAEVRERWPWTGASAGALWAPRDGALNPVRLVEALIKDAVRLGAVVKQEEVVSVERRGDRITGVRTTEFYPAADVVVANGAWARQLGGMPRPLAVEPIRGQMAALAWPDGIPPSIMLSRDHYIVARDGEAVIGSTMEHAGYTAEVTASGLAEIFTGASAICPSLAKGDVLRTWAGLRPVSPDGLPIVGREPRLNGLYYATAHGRNGILLSGITGAMICRMLGGENELELLAPLRPERFWSW